MQYLDVAEGLVAEPLSHVQNGNHGKRHSQACYRIIGNAAENGHSRSYGPWVVVTGCISG